MPHQPVILAGWFNVMRPAERQARGDKKMTASPTAAVNPGKSSKFSAVSEFLPTEPAYTGAQLGDQLSALTGIPALECFDAMLLASASNINKLAAQEQTPAVMAEIGRELFKNQDIFRERAEWLAAQPKIGGAI